MSYIYNLTDTWNAAGTTFTSIKMNVTDTASAAGSKLIDLQKGSASYFQVDKNGNVGVGQSSVTAVFGTTLEVKGSTGATQKFAGSTVSGYLYASDGLGVGGLTLQSNHPLLFATNDQERMRIDAVGNVGIGQNSITAVFGRTISVTGTSGATHRITGAAVTSLWYCSDGLARVSFGSSTSHPLTFFTSDLERARIDTSGNVLLGTTASPTTGTQCLTIETGTAPTATPADTFTIYSSAVSAGNTTLSLYTEGTPVSNSSDATVTRKIAIRINGTLYYLLADTDAS